MFFKLFIIYTLKTIFVIYIYIQIIYSIIKTIPNKLLNFDTPALLIKTSRDFNVFLIQAKASNIFFSERKSTFT